jgi:hypothetical protein
MRNSNAQLGKFHFKQMVNHNEMSETILANVKRIRKTIQRLAGVKRNGDISDYPPLSPSDFVAKVDDILGKTLTSISNALTKSEQGQGLAVFDLRQAYRQHMMGHAMPIDFREKAREDPEVTKQKDFALRRLHQADPLTPTAEPAALIAQRKHQLVVRNRKTELLKSVIPHFRSTDPLPSQDYAHHYINDWGQMDCLTEEQIKSLPTQGFDAVKSHIPITQTVVLSVKEHFKPKVMKVDGSTTRGRTRVEKYKTGQFVYVSDPQNL